MVLDHAPVTGLAMILSSLSGAVTGEQYNRPPHRLTLRRAAVAATHHTDASRFTQFRRMCAESIPFGGLGTSLEDMALSLGLLFQMRVLERRWGSASFLSFLLHAAALGVFVLHAVTGPPGAGEGEAGSPLDRFIPADPAGRGAVGVFFSPEAVRILTGAASLVPLTALITRYFLEVPVSGTTPPTASGRAREADGAHGSRGGFSALRVPGTSIPLAQGAALLLPLAKLALSPNGMLEAPTHKRDGVSVTVGWWPRVLLVVVGLIYGLASARSPWLRWWLRLIAQKVCAPLLNVLRPILLTPVFGSPKVVTHALPPHVRRQQQREAEQAAMAMFGGAAGGGGWEAGTGAQEDGRIQVDSLNGAGRPMPPVRQRRRRRQPDADGAAGGAPPPAPVNQAAVQQIMEMGLGQGEEEVAAALRQCGGDVTAAINLLLS